MSEATPMIELDGVTKRFAGKEVLAPTTLRLDGRSSLALIGPSGCGKSTLLRLVIGLLAPDAGRVRVAGTEVGPATAGALRRRMGYVIQDGGLFPHLSALDNVTLMARHLGWPAERIQARAAELAALVHLSEAMLARFPVELSGGQRQRVGLMRALMLDPDLLLLDEPMGALDPMVRRALQDDLVAIFAQLGKTVLLVTHDLAEAAFLAREVALMHEGRVLQRGPIEALIEQPAAPFVRDFLRAQRGPEKGAWAAAR
jgi:osmoprotectant transport system ATP-binding protein